MKVSEIKKLQCFNSLLNSRNLEVQPKLAFKNPSIPFFPSPTRETLTNRNYQSFCELGKSLKYSLTTTFKNPNFESKDKF